ncbi:unnamed protein product [Laminaria digitata]
MLVFGFYCFVVALCLWPFLVLSFVWSFCIVCFCLSINLKYHRTAGLGLRPERMFVLDSLYYHFFSVLVFPLVRPSVFRVYEAYHGYVPRLFFAASDAGWYTPARWNKSIAYCFYRGARSVLCLFGFFHRDAFLLSVSL